jgi:hypothetical protein
MFERSRLNQVTIAVKYVDDMGAVLARVPGAAAAGKPAAVMMKMMKMMMMITVRAGENRSFRSTSRQRMDQGDPMEAME